MNGALHVAMNRPFQLACTVCSYKFDAPLRPFIDETGMNCPRCTSWISARPGEWQVKGRA